MYVLISYDIVDDKRRLKVMKFLKDFGKRVQLSVFECHLTEEQLAAVRSGMRDLINHRKDRVRYWPICRACAARVEVDGWGEVQEEEESFAIV
ncbi:MAG: CRISPR-associated endonuclease Cas2 [Dissulfuribacterales bacterium]